LKCSEAPLRYSLAVFKIGTTVFMKRYKHFTKNSLILI
jgi:hypothetical protein